MAAFNACCPIRWVIVWAVGCDGDGGRGDGMVLQVGKRGKGKGVGCLTSLTRVKR